MRRIVLTIITVGLLIALALPALAGHRGVPGGDCSTTTTLAPGRTPPGG